MLRKMVRKAKGTKKKPFSVAKRMAAYRRRMRAQGLRPVQLWVPDTTSPAFRAECRRQSRAVAKHDRAEEEIMDWIETVYEWPEP